jgi:hypothetical protein
MVTVVAVEGEKVVAIVAIVIELAQMAKDVAVDVNSIDTVKLAKCTSFYLWSLPFVSNISSATRIKGFTKLGVVMMA